MFGYTLPAYSKLAPTDLKRYRRYYCEGCHQLREGFGVTGTATVNYDMTFNTILLAGIMGEGLDFGDTTAAVCVLDHPKADSEMMRKMAAYTLILTKWELVDDDTDKPSAKTKLVSLALNRAIEKAVSLHPDYDEMVGEGFSKLRDLELAGCRDARRMGNVFGSGLIGPLEDIAGEFSSPDLDRVFVELSTAVYLMDAVDDLEDDFMDGTYNPLLPETGFVNRARFMDSNVFGIASLINETVGSLQGSYSVVRKDMKGNQSLCDNIVYFGIPESARKVMTGEAKAKASVKNILSNRRERMSE